MSKYHVAPAAARTMDGIRFDSKAEMRRYIDLCLLQRASVIAKLELQPVYVLLEPFTDRLGCKHRGIKYIADFRYVEGGRTVVEDVKGFLTRDYVIKRELFIKQYPEVEFRETSTRRRKVRSVGEGRRKYGHDKSKGNERRGGGESRCPNGIPQ